MGWKRRMKERSLSRGGRRSRNFSKNRYHCKAVVDFLANCVYSGKYVFPPHFFESYISRVSDPLLSKRDEQSIADLVANSLDRSVVPDSLHGGQNLNVLVNLVDYKIPGELFIGSYHIPIDRDRFSPNGLVVVKTIKHTDLSFERIYRSRV